MNRVEVVRFESSELVACDQFLLADRVLKRYCNFLLDQRLESNEPLIPLEADLSQIESNDGRGQAAGTRAPPLATSKQLILARSCLSDVLYSILYLGQWCAERTIKLYLTEFSRLLQSNCPSGDLIATTATILNCLYSRLHEITNQLRSARKNAAKYAQSDQVGGDEEAATTAAAAELAEAAEAAADKHEDTEFEKELLLKGSTAQLRSLLSYIKEFKPPPNTAWPICIIHVRRKVVAKVIALWLSEIASTHEEHSYIKPNYIVGSYRKHRNRMAVDNFDLHHETSIRDFRFGKCNTLVVSSSNERCTAMLKCNLVISFDWPNKYSEFVSSKVNCRNDSSKYVIFLNDLLEDNVAKRVWDFIQIEKVLNCSGKREAELEESDLIESLESTYPQYPSKSSKSPATIWRSINIINKYCAKLPSDSFTKLAPDWRIKEMTDDNGQTKYYCEVRLPINSPVRQTIIGPLVPTKNIAMKLAAFTACKVLHKAGELDDNMLTIKKESMKTMTPWLGPKESTGRPRPKGKGQSIGSTKHRQYYKKRIAKVFSGPLVKEGVECFLYKFSMVLTCPIPDEQNRRGRRIIDPSETNRNYAIVCTTKLPKICSFPVFTRSGEVMISVELVTDKFKLSEQQVVELRTFHEFTFSKVLRLEKYPTMFDPDNSPFTVLLAPVTDSKEGSTEIDWTFVEKIVISNRDSYTPSVAERRKFKFNYDDYVDAVVIPWYRLTDRQQFAYYVAEICTNMSPRSPFPDESSGFETFIDYYKSKYDIEIFNEEQPVLDVDHTSARLNLLTPRYVNRKGRTLPSSTAKTRKESRESLVQKQLLIPELCTIHPFPASFWRKAVCLPCIFYRLNSLFLAEELRREVAQAIKVGYVEPPEGSEWPQLDFGWSLKDVINNQVGDDNDSENQNSSFERSDKRSHKKSSKSKSKTSAASKKPQAEARVSREQDPPATTGLADFVIDHFDPSQYDIPDIPLDAPPEDWMNIKLISSSSSQGNTNKGWDQPLEQRDLYLQHTNEITWSDCEMEFDGEISERPAEMRCGSPSAFEPGIEFCNGFNQKFTGARGTTGARVVKFEDLSEEEDSMEDNNKAQNLNEMRRTAAFDSDSSWSISEDDGNEADDDEPAAGYAEWKDEKIKSQPVLRELFVPFIKLETGESELDVAFRRALSEHQSQSKVDNQAANVVKGDSEQLLINTINGLNLDENRLAIDNFDTLKINRQWCDLIKKFDERILASLKANPEMLKDTGIELITVDDSVRDYNLEMQPTFGELLPNRDFDCNWTSEEWKSIKFDPTRREIKSVGPGPSVILQALTMSNASDGINLERLETVGDSFLKYSITAYLYCTYPSMHEGKLSYLRSTEISNANLYHLGKSKNLGELMSATKFEPNDNWLPPGYSVADGSLMQVSSGSESTKKREIDKALAEVPYDLLRQHSIPDKSIADCVEALIGAYLTASGSRAALLFMQWLGLRIVPPTFDLEKDLQNVDSMDESENWRWLEAPSSPLICVPPSCCENSAQFLPKPSPEELRQDALKELETLYYSNNMDKFESDIQYTFKDKAYLIQAFTHNSFHENHVTDCHQRLEFLGDALLDYLITRYLFEDPRCHSPGTLTDLRSALVNNTFFASLAVKYEFHKYLKYISDELFNVIDGFVKKFRFESKDTITKGYTLLISEGESEYAEDIEVPKALGDVFESVAGAIYLDSGMSLDQVWEVYFKMMKPEIEYFSSNVPKSPIRELLESMPQNVRFSPSELAPDRKHRVTAEVFGLGRFIGVGRNKHSAKSTAAKRALRMLALKRRKQEEQLEEEDQNDAS